MRDIWNPWHGCRKVSEGCQNCYMYFLDSQRGGDGSYIFKVKQNFDYPLQKDRYGNYKIKSGEFLRVCMTSDFFLEEADEWRLDAWEIMKIRKDVVFILVTKRPERILSCLPPDWENGWENIWLNVTAENQKRADERIPILLNLPFKHKGIMIAPFIGKVSLDKYLKTSIIENVWSGGENYSGARPLYYEWVESLSEECRRNDVSFSFFETGNIFFKDGKQIFTRNKQEQMKAAYLLNLNYESTRPQIFDIPVDKDQISLFELHEEKHYRDICNFCAMRKQCSGCSNCGKCDSTN